MKFTFTDRAAEDGAVSLFLRSASPGSRDNNSSKLSSKLY